MIYIRCTPITYAIQSNRNLQFTVLLPTYKDLLLQRFDKCTYSCNFSTKPLALPFHVISVSSLANETMFWMIFQ